mmetsp:Transcript_12070/g.18540  ORF Transcript_12070/g.18540 Transcript_12070/m.18540 type:complete len:129 (-) Transcript_12070:1834-2220(-)
MYFKYELDHCEAEQTTSLIQGRPTDFLTTITLDIHFKAEEVMSTQGGSTDVYEVNDSIMWEGSLLLGEAFSSSISCMSGFSWRVCQGLRGSTTITSLSSESSSAGASENIKADVMHDTSLICDSSAGT